MLSRPRQLVEPLHGDQQFRNQAAGRKASDRARPDGSRGPCPACARSLASGRLRLSRGRLRDDAWLGREVGRLSMARAQLPQQHTFGVGFITWSLLRQPHLLDLALAANPRAVLLSFGDPEPFVRRIKDAGALLVCQVQDVGMAIDVVAKGA